MRMLLLGLRGPALDGLELVTADTPTRALAVDKPLLALARQPNQATDQIEAVNREELEKRKRVAALARAQQAAGAQRREAMVCR